MNESDHGILSGRLVTMVPSGEEGADEEDATKGSVDAHVHVASGQTTDDG